MNIDQLRKIRNKNVQQQNELSFLEMKHEAELFRKDVRIYPWLSTLLSDYSMLPSDGILISCSDVPEQGGIQWMGTWLTFSGIFYEFDIMASYESGVLIEVEGWNEVKPEIIAHSKGKGKTFGYLALQLLAEYEKVNKNCLANHSQLSHFLKQKIR